DEVGCGNRPILPLGAPGLVGMRLFIAKAPRCAKKTHIHRAYPFESQVFTRLISPPASTFSCRSLSILLNCLRARVGHDFDEAQGFSREIFARELTKRSPSDSLGGWSEFLPPSSLCSRSALEPLRWSTRTIGTVGWAMQVHTASA